MGNDGIVGVGTGTVGSGRPDADDELEGAALTELLELELEPLGSGTPDVGRGMPEVGREPDEVDAADAPADVPADALDPPGAGEPWLAPAEPADPEAAFPGSKLDGSPVALSTMPPASCPPRAPPDCPCAAWGPSTAVPLPAVMASRANAPAMPSTAAMPAAAIAPAGGLRRGGGVAPEGGPFGEGAGGPSGPRLGAWTSTAPGCPADGLAAFG
ncbi:MAG: hypothetical protein QOJ26_1239 [Thermoplasmata archaeon]|nr:hypothetical protein [Thermoplasmata archaeon]